MALTSFLSSASKTSQRPRTRRPHPRRSKHPKHKTTPSPEAPKAELGKYVVPGEPCQM